MRSEIHVLCFFAPDYVFGAMPGFICSEKDTWNMNPDLLEYAIKERIARTGKKPKAIVTVALYGMPYRTARIMEISGRCGILSFNGNKMITTSGGGALITEN